MEVERSDFAGEKCLCQCVGLDCSHSKHRFYRKLASFHMLQHTQEQKRHLVRRKPHQELVLIPWAHLTHFTREASLTCSHWLFIRIMRIILRVSPHSLCPYVRHFLSLCVQYSTAFPWDILHQAQTSAHLGARWEAFCSPRSFMTSS